MPRPLPFLIACLLPVAPLVAKSPAPDPWQAALSLDYNAASETFESLHAADPADTRVAIALASSLLVKQPRTLANIRRSHDILLKAADTADSADHRVLAGYLVARIELDHLIPAQPDSARARLEQLRRDHPDHPLADHAAVQLAYQLAYPSSGADTSAIPQVTALLDSVKAPGAVRDIRHLLGTLQLLRNDSAAALPHFVAARAIGFEQPLRDSGVDLTIANLARETGDIDLARRHYGAFLAAAPRDNRASTVRRILASLGSSSVATASAER